MRNQLKVQRKNPRSPKSKTMKMRKQRPEGLGPGPQSPEPGPDSPGQDPEGPGQDPEGLGPEGQGPDIS